MANASGGGLLHDKFYTIAEVAERLSVSTKSVRRAITAKHLPVYRFGGALRIVEADLLQYISDRRKEFAG